MRCIKPNYEQMPNLFDKPRVLPPLYSFTYVRAMMALYLYVLEYIYTQHSNI